VKHVWCGPSEIFSIDLLHPGLKAIVLAIFNTDDDIPRGRTADWLYGPIRNIYGLFRKKLTADQRAQMAVWYDNNNDIEALCACDPHKLPVTYSEIGVIDLDLKTALKAFCTSLFETVIHLTAVTRQIGQIDAHYADFVSANNEDICPYCGYSDIMGMRRTRREAYDHFLPKGTYPFNSVNFRNLAPMCHECNSSYKLQKDPIRFGTSGPRRKAFYSYAGVSPGITISVTLKTKDVTKLLPREIDLQLTAPGRIEEVKTWKDVFSIEERYKDKLCGKNGGMAWLQEIIDEAENYGKNKDEMLAQVKRVADRSPYSGANFLKYPFLAACEEAKLI
jgi:hypothetical protein